MQKLEALIGLFWSFAGLVMLATLWVIARRENAKNARYLAELDAARRERSLREAP